MKLKRWITAVSAAALFACVMPVHVHADEDFSDTTYWTERCTNISNLRGDDKQNCEIFLQKMAEQSDSLSDQLNEIDSQRSEIAANIEEYENKIEEYQNQIDDLRVQIDDLQEEIDTLQENIDEKQAEADDLEEKVMNQIENSQPTMRLSKVIDVLMGAKTFTELIQIINGLSDMTEYNDRTMDNLVAVMQELKDTQKQLDDKQTELESTQEEALVNQYQAQVIQDEYEAQKAELDSQYSELQLSSEALSLASDAVVQAQQEAAAQEAAEAAAAAAEEALKQQQGGGGSASSGGGTSNSTPNYSANATAEQLALGAEIVNYGMQFVGCAYVWGGTTPAGFDCSGLTQYVYRHFGIYIGRTSYVQESAGVIIPLSQAIPGDLITWNGHAGIYIGNNMVLNAMDPSLGVRTCPLSWITNGNMLIHRIF